MDRPPHDLRSLASDERGTQVTETALVLIPMLLFLFLAPAVWKVWMHDQVARTEAHRSTMWKLTVPQRLPQLPVKDFMFKVSKLSVHEEPEFPAKLEDILKEMPKEKVPKDQRPLRKQGLDEDEEEAEEENEENEKKKKGPAVLKLSNHFVEGWSWQDFDNTIGYFKGFDGEMELARYGAAIRSPWTWLGWPFVPTQDFYFEPRQVHLWFEDAYNYTLESDAGPLGLDKRPLKVDKEREEEESGGEEEGGGEGGGEE